MKKYILTILPFFLALQLSAQYGFNISYNTFEASNWDKMIQNTGIPEAKPISEGFSFGLDRWYKIKGKRIEFFPELGGSFYKADWGTIGNISTTAVGLYGNTNFYIFDMEGDCDCPTFSKDGNLLKKGFFLQVSPGISFMQLNLKRDQTEQNTRAFTPSIGIGAGLDIGVMDLVTISPFIRYRHHFAANWKEMNTALSNDGIAQEESLNKSNIQTWQFGIRLGLRLDQGRSRRYR